MRPFGLDHGTPRLGARLVPLAARRKRACETQVCFDEARVDAERGPQQASASSATAAAAARFRGCE